MNALFARAAVALCLASAVAFAADAPPPPEVAALKASHVDVFPENGGGWRVEFRDPKTFTDENWKQVESLPNVRKFSAGGEAFDDAQLAHLAKVASLEAIFLNGPGVTDEGLAVLAKLPRLSGLTVHHSQRISGSGLVALKDLSSLRLIGFGGCGKIDDKSVETIAQLHQLREVEVGHDRNTRASFPALAQMPELERLFITPQWNPHAYTGADFAKFANCPHLREFEIHDMVLSYESGLSQLAAIKSLKTLRLGWCVVDDAGLARLKAERPDIKVVVEHPAGDEQRKMWEQKLKEPG